VIHTDHSPEKLSGTLRQLSFEFSREAWLDGTHVLEFYQDIYHRPDSPGASGNAMILPPGAREYIAGMIDKKF
jgi:hypothetical protein